MKCKLIQLAKLQSWPVEITIFTHVRLSVRLYVPTFQNLARQNKAKTMFDTGETVGLAVWIIDDTCLVIDYVFHLQISWVRNRDSYVLFTSNIKVITDNRFDLLRSVVASKESNSAPNSAISRTTMRLNFAEAEDAGDYECQISTSPKKSKTFRLNVIGKCIEISHITLKI